MDVYCDIMSDEFGYYIAGLLVFVPQTSLSDKNQFVPKLVLSFFC